MDVLNGIINVTFLTETLKKETTFCVKPGAALHLIEELFSYIACSDGAQICSVLDQYVQVYILSI